MENLRLRVDITGIWKTVLLQFGINGKLAKILNIYKQKSCFILQYMNDEKLIHEGQYGKKNIIKAYRIKSFEAMQLAELGIHHTE